MKRFLSILLLCCLMFTFTACNNNEQKTTEPTLTTDATISPEQTEPISEVIDEENGVYYKNNNWNNGVFVDEIVGNQVAKYEDVWPTLEAGDLYVSDIFMYGYNMKFDGEKWIEDSSINGWSVRYKNKEAVENARSYQVQTYINKEPVVNASHALSYATLSNCTSGILLGDFVTDISNLLQETKLTEHVTIVGKNIETYDGAFDVQWDTKRKENGATIYECSKNITLRFTNVSFETIILMAASAKYANVNMVLLDNMDGVANIDEIIQNPTIPADQRTE